LRLKARGIEETEIGRGGWGKGSGGMGAGDAKGKGNKARVEVGPAAEGSPRQALESLVARGLGGDSEKSNAEYGGVPIKDAYEKAERAVDAAREERNLTREKQEEKCGDVRERLINRGPTLELPTTNSQFWRTIPGTNEIWKPPECDVYVQQELLFRKKNGRIERIELNAAQAEYSRRRGKLNIVLKARQVGITSYIAARYFMQTISQPGTFTMLVAHDRIAAEEIFRIVHRFWDHLGDEYRKGPLKPSHSSARELVFPQMDSEFTVASADENAGRGRTIQNLHCTEVSRWGQRAADALASLRAAVTPGGEIVLESTANGAWGAFYEEWQQAEETGYTKHFFPWWFEASYVTPIGPQGLTATEEEAALQALHGLTNEQLAWRRRQWAALRSMAAQEFAEDAVSCFKASGECVFEIEPIEKALGALDGPVATRDNGRELIWMPAAAKRKYVIGADPAGGLADGDYSCAEVVELEKGTQCAELVGHFHPREFGNRVIKLAKEYNGALVAVERNNHGTAVLVQLEREGYEPLYVQKGQAGWYTSAANRPEMIANLGDILFREAELFHSARLLNECRTFVRSTTGTPGAAPGAHDDCVMAMAIALAVRAELGGKRTKKKSAEAGE